MLRKERGEQYLMQDQDARLDWQEVRDLIKKHGMRNSNVLAIAPTATIANSCGVTQSIEPTYKNLFVKSNLSGEFTVVNPSLVKDLQGLQLWDQPMVHALKLSNGSVQNIDRIPENIRAKYKTAFEVDISYIVRAAAKRAKWLDQSQSLNLYMPVASGKKLDALYKQAWLSGLKTCYYLRSLGATDSEKSSVSDGALNAVSVHSAAAKVCSIDNPDCEACQ
jgi:ribonucleoside-diphosphate reductase alpha chain